MQLLAVALGGALHQDLAADLGLAGHQQPAPKDAAGHAVAVAPGTLLAAAGRAPGRLAVNSTHHQAVRAAGARAWWCRRARRTASSRPSSCRRGASRWACSGTRRRWCATSRATPPSTPGWWRPPRPGREVRRGATVLVVAGLDPSGGAGLAADLEALGRRGRARLAGGGGAHRAGAARRARLEPGAGRRCCWRRWTRCSTARPARPGAVKTGMLGTAELARALAARLSARDLARVPLVVDPVLLSSSGTLLLDLADGSPAEALGPLLGAGPPGDAQPRRARGADRARRWAPTTRRWRRRARSGPGPCW